MKLIDADSLDITTIITDDYSGNEILEVILKEDIDDTPPVPAIPIGVIGEIKAELEKIKITVSLSKPCFTQDQIDIYKAAMNNAISVIDKHIKEYTE